MCHVQSGLKLHLRRLRLRIRNGNFTERLVRHGNELPREVCRHCLCDRRSLDVALGDRVWGDGDRVWGDAAAG